MKVLSDNTADRLLRHLDAAEGDVTPRRIPRGAATTPPALMWQIHVTAEGEVTVDGGDIYRDGTRYTLEPSSPGAADGERLVVWSGSGAGAVSLAAPGSTLRKPFRILGKVRKDKKEGSVYYSVQYITCPIEIYSSSSGGGGGGDGGGDDEGDDEESPGQKPDPNNPPPCGNPLNATDDTDPFSEDGGADDDYNPLNYEGEGGYTPTCFGDDAQ